MVYIITTGEAPLSAKLRGVQINLVNALNYAEEINRQLDEMSDAQAEAQFGLPTAAVATFRTQVDGLVTTLQSANVTNIISSLGFAK